MANSKSGVESVITSALTKVRTPTGANLVDAGVVVALRGGASTLTVRLRDPGWGSADKSAIQQEIQTAVQSSLPALETVQVEWTAEPASGKSAAAPGAPDIARIIAVGSGKGGVGKSTVAASLAYAFAELGERVGLMDADVYGPSIPHMLGVNDVPNVADNRYHPPIVDGMPVMSMGFLVPRDQAVVWRGPMLHKAVQDFLYRVEWGSLDTLVIDLPPGTGDVVLSLSQQMPITGGVIVCTPQEVALLDARKALGMLRTVKISCLGVVENMSYFVEPVSGNRVDIFGHGGAERWAHEAGIPFLGAIPLDVQTRIHGDEGQVRQNLAPESLIRESILNIAKNLQSQWKKEELSGLPEIEVIE